MLLTFRIFSAHPSNVLYLAEKLMNHLHLVKISTFAAQPNIKAHRPFGKSIVDPLIGISTIENIRISNIPLAIIHVQVNHSSVYSCVLCRRESLGDNSDIVKEKH